MESKIEWTEIAFGDLAEITSYIAEDNLDAGLRFGNELIEHAELLALFPRKGRFVLPGLGPIRLTIYGSYKIYYTYDEERNLVTIHHIRHGARLDPDFGALE